jgi:Tfp pilus assembly protein FimT
MKNETLNISKHSAGFSLMDILISLSILTIVTTSIFLSLSTFQISQSLNTEADKIIDILHNARARTISAEGDGQYGVHLESTKVVLFVGDTYNALDIDNEEHLMDTFVSISEISLFLGDSDVIFKKQTGETDYYGTLVVSLVSEPNKKRTITLYQTGIANR